MHAVVWIDVLAEQFSVATEDTLHRSSVTTRQQALTRKCISAVASLMNLDFLASLSDAMCALKDTIAASFKLILMSNLSCRPILYKPTETCTFATMRRWEGATASALHPITFQAVLLEIKKGWGGGSQDGYFMKAERCEATRSCSAASNSLCCFPPDLSTMICAAFATMSSKSFEPICEKGNDRRAFLTHGLRHISKSMKMNRWTEAPPWDCRRRC